MLNKVLVLTLIFILQGCSCQKEEKKLSRLDIYNMVREIDPDMQLIMPKSIADGVHCTDYTPGCESGHRVLLNKLEVIFVKFKSSAHAKRAAYKFKGYYLNNWLLDDFRGEPSLERIAEKKLGAIKVDEYIKPYPEEIKKMEEGKKSGH